MAKNTEWREDEFVTYDEYAYYGISGDTRDRNLERSEKKGYKYEDLCPFCMKPLKEGSYRILTYVSTNVGTFYNNANVAGEPVKVGNGCFKHIMQAYKEKYNK